MTGYDPVPSPAAPILFTSMTLYATGSTRDELLRQLPADSLGHRWFERGTTTGLYFPGLPDVAVFVSSCYLCDIIRVGSSPDGRHPTPPELVNDRYFAPDRSDTLIIGRWLFRCPAAVPDPPRGWRRLLRRRAPRDA